MSRPVARARARRGRRAEKCLVVAVLDVHIRGGEADARGLHAAARARQPAGAGRAAGAVGAGLVGARGAPAQ
jgi:hypothetical protein